MISPTAAGPILSLSQADHFRNRRRQVDRRIDTPMKSLGAAGDATAKNVDAASLQEALKAAAKLGEERLVA
jgi:hypothetical protein